MVTFNRFRSAFLGAFALWASGCGAEDQVRFDQRQAALGQELSGAPVFVRDSGHWGTYVYHAASSQSFWVDLSVAAPAPGKTIQEVGVVWTLDGWQTRNEARASFEHLLVDGRAQWGVDVRDFAVFAPWLADPNPDVEYAAYVIVDGETSWSPYRNHSIYAGVTPERPLRLLDSSVSIDEDGAVRLEGRVRALAVSGPARVKVRVSTDHFRSTTELDAQRGARDAHFSASLDVDPERTEAVEFIVEFEAEGETIALDSGGAPFRHDLRPQLGARDLEGDFGFATAGIKRLTASVRSDLPMDGASLIFDGVEPRIELPRLDTSSISGFDAQGSVQYAFTTEDLADGAHAVELEVRNGPFTRRFPLARFDVDNALMPTGSFALPGGQTGGTPWDFERTIDGRYLMSRDHGVDVYAAIGDTSPSATFQRSPASAYQRQIALDPTGRVHGLSDGGLVRWTADGRLDLHFGEGGLLELSSVAPTTLCYAADVEVSTHHIYVVDSCNARVLRLTLDGVFEDALPLEVPGRYTNVHDTFLGPSGLWVGRTTLADGASTSTLIRLADEAAAPLSVLEEVVLPPEVGTLDAFAVVADGFWIASDGGVVSRLDPAGRRRATWTGGDNLSGWTRPGALSIATKIAPMEDGSVEVLSVGSARIERLSPRAP